MIDDMVFRWFRTMKGRCHDNVNTNGRNLHVSVFIIGLTESPEVIILTRPFTITRIPENSSIISDRVFFIITPTKIKELNVDEEYKNAVSDIEHLDMNAVNKIFEYINKTIHASYE